MAFINYETERRDKEFPQEENSRIEQRDLPLDSSTGTPRKKSLNS